MTKAKSDFRGKKTKVSAQQAKSDYAKRLIKMDYSMKRKYLVLRTGYKATIQKIQSYDTKDTSI